GLKTPQKAAPAPAKKPAPTLSQDSAREIRLRLARLLRGPIGDAERALEVFQEILKDDPEHQEALEAAIELYEATGRYAELADAFVKRGDPELDLVKRKALLGRAAAIFQQRLNEPKKALSAWQKVVLADEADVEALSAQEALLEQLGESAALAESLEIHARYADDARPRI